MTKHLLLALALTLGTAAVSVPQASACGGYGSLQSPDEQAVREAVLAVAERRFGEGSGASVSNVQVDGDRAQASLVVPRNYRWETHQVTLRNRGGAWRVASFA